MHTVCTPPKQVYIECTPLPPLPPSMHFVCMDHTFKFVYTVPTSAHFDQQGAQTNLLVPSICPSATEETVLWHTRAFGEYGVLPQNRDRNPLPVCLIMSPVQFEISVSPHSRQANLGESAMQWRRHARR